MDRVKNIQLQAMRAIVTPDDDALFRFVCRWFSEKFSTPLMDVYDLPADFVLQHYFEDMFSNMSRDERYKRAIELIETQAERQERLRREESEITEQVATVRGVKSSTKKLTEEVKDRPKTAMEMQLAEMFGKLKPKIAPATPDNPGVKEVFDEEIQDALDVNQTPAVKEGGGESTTNNPESPAPRIPPAPPEDLEFSLGEDDIFGDFDPLGAASSKPKPLK